MDLRTIGYESQQAEKAAHAEQLCEGGELLFELHGPEGKAWRLYLNGRIEGFPDGTLILNYALPLVNKLLGEVLRPVQQPTSSDQT